MSYAIVFSSKTGNTELLADTLHNCLPQEDCCYFGIPNPACRLPRHCYCCFWNRGCRLPCIATVLTQSVEPPVFWKPAAESDSGMSVCRRLQESIRLNRYSLFPSCLPPVCPMRPMRSIPALYHPMPMKTLQHYFCNIRKNTRI